MLNYREILRLHSLGYNKTTIAERAQCLRDSVRTVCTLAQEHGLQWPLPESLSNFDI
ncbi:MAG: hypothetical protein FWG30_08720 [Eubacteriaceae bacterium]|nr:hypothetical protein [Eubacteriaceae bacterium]